MGDLGDQTVTLQPGLVRVRARNPSPMTHTGTNSYVLGEDRLTIIDPGPNLPDHRQALLSAIAGRDVTQIVVTHSHLDHSPLAHPLSDELQAPVVAFGDSESGRSDVMRSLAEAGYAGGGEGVDPDFAPHIMVKDGERIENDIEVIHTPGHMGNHISLAWNNAVFTGDLVMGWASSLVSPPDGDLTEFMSSCRKLQQRSETVFHAGHGDPMTAPHDRLCWLIDHRLARSNQIEKALELGPATVLELTAAVYTDVPVQMHPMAARNVFAHLIDLVGRSLVRTDGPLHEKAIFRIA